MQPISKHTGLVMPLDRVNVDTDQMVPKQFLKALTRQGFGRNLFYDWRYLPGEVPNPEFVLNFPRYRGASVLLARANFGCGSSREHAPWALQEYGFRVLIAPSFADIFYNNYLGNGMLPIVLAPEEVDALFAAVAAQEGYRLRVSLPAQTVTTPDGRVYRFAIDAFRKESLLRGLDAIGWTEQYDSAIDAYEARRRDEEPWLFVSG